jgi:Mg-chelatase subunit ChlI
MLTKTELQERRAQFAADGAKAMAEYLAEPEAVRVRTARLRALRLQRELLDAAEKQKATAIIKKKVVTPRKSRKRVIAPASLPH